MSINYFRSGTKIEVTIRDETDAKVETHICDCSDRKKYAKLLKYLKDKWDFVPEIDVNESVNSQEVGWWD